MQRRLTELRAAEPIRLSIITAPSHGIGPSTDGIPAAKVEAEMTDRLHEISASVRQEATTMLAKRLAGSG
jgi:hypothetical protein